MTRLDHRSVPAFGALALLVLTGAMMYGLTVLFSALYASLHDLAMATASGHIQRDLPILTLVQLCAMGTALVVGLRMFDPETPLVEAVAMRPVRPLTLGVCFAAGVCLQLPLTELANALHAYVFGPDPLEQQLALQNMLEARTLVQGLTVVGCIAAVVPLMEELLFRGFFLFGLARRYGNGFALIVSSCFFGIVHMAAVPAVYATVAGLVLGVLALATRSVWPGVAVHAAINALPVLIPERALPVEGFNVPSAAATHLAPWLVWPPLAVGVALLFVAARLEPASERA
ncbi:MAG: CPBP family intramembrane glutamic endopeptidase [Polyangiales bacterium]